MKRVLALDPGDKVGWARADIADDGTWTNLRHGITPLKPMALSIFEHTAKWVDVDRGNGFEPKPDYDVVVCETWRLYPHMAKHIVGSEIPSAQFVGMVKLSCWLANVPLKMQGANKVNSNKPGVLAPAEATMRKIRPELFETVSVSGAHDDQHDLVAIKHLWFYTTQTTDVLNA